MTGPVTHRLLAALIVAPGILGAQALVIRDPNPPPVTEARFTGARLMKSGIASQFDSLGEVPMGSVGDPVTVYLFPDGDHLERTVHARIVRRQRFQPPSSWRAACDEVAHPGWFFALAPAARAPFAVVVPGTFAAPTVNPIPSDARAGAWQFFKRVADSSWERYRDYLKPASDRALEYAHDDFWTRNNDALWSKVRMVGVRGPGGKNYAAFSFAMRDDYPDRPGTARIWIVDAWGYPVATAVGSIDIYGTVNDGATDAVVSSSGLIRWDGSQWQFPPVYSEEPCLFHQVMDPPAGAQP
ncbi:MAG TPA: hypothetical protein VGL65_04180 [Gemmatimonadales bacterium]